MRISKRLKKYKKQYPNTVKYIARNLRKNRRCNVCGAPILLETNISGYPYQCMNCDENRFPFETYESEKTISDAELEQLVENTADLLLLDDEHSAYDEERRMQI